MSPSLYDLLDVEPDASADEIRAAWKAAIADLSPGDRRFRAYNQAAEVLLDPERRAAYDADLVVTEEPAEVVPPEPAGPDPTPEPEPEPTPEPVRELEPEPVPEEEPAPEAASAGEPTRVATWMLAVVALVAAAMLVTTILVWQDHLAGEESTASDAEDTGGAALEAAELAAGPVLSYDYRTFDDGITDAQSYMTPAYKAEHSALMNELRPIATSQKITVTAEFKGSAIVRVTGDRADILVLVNQVTRKAGSEPFVLPIWATLQMVEDDGTWLVDKLINSQAPITS